MRKPTDRHDAEAWWRAALAGQKPQITTEPRVGWYKRRLVRGGPYVPGRLWLNSPTDPDTGELVGDEEMLCVVDGRMRADVLDQWLYLASCPISCEEYAYLVSVSRYAKEHDPAEPLARPEKKIDRMTFPLPTFEPVTFGPAKKERRS